MRLLVLLFLTQTLLFSCENPGPLRSTDTGMDIVEDSKTHIDVKENMRDTTRLTDAGSLEDTQGEDVSHDGGNISNDMGKEDEYKNYKKYYISPTGDDGDSGSESEPWKTLSKAAENLEAGEMVFVRAGTYKEHFRPKKSGNADKYIIFAAYPGEKAIIDGKGLALDDGSSGLILIDKLSYIKIIGLQVQNVGSDYDHSYSQAGILIRDSDHIEIKNCRTYNTFSSGIRATSSDHILVESNEVEKACNNGEHECISMTEGTSDFIIRSNHVFNGGPDGPKAKGDYGGEGIDIKQGAHDGEVYDNHVHHLANNRLGIYVDSYEKHTYNVKIYNNVVHDCGEGGITVASETGGLTENVDIFNNLIYHNEYYGITIANWVDGFPHPMKKIRVFNNTIFNNKWGNQDWDGGIIMSNLFAKDVIIRNNISQGNIKSLLIEGGVNLGELTVDHNLLDSAPDGKCDDCIIGDASFVDSDKNDFHLKAGSPAIDSGSSSGAPKKDFDGKTRPQNKVDIGAFEK